MPINWFEPRTLLGVWEQTGKRAQTFLQTLLFSRLFQSTTEHIDLDEVTKKRIMARFVAVEGVGQSVGRTGFKANTYIPPALKPRIAVKQLDLQQRMAGEAIYDGMTPAERETALVQRDLLAFDDMITRRIEWMCAQVIFGGVVTMVGDDYQETLDFGLTNKTTLGAAAKWNVAGTSHPLTNLATWCLAVENETGVSPTTCLMGSEALTAFLGHAEVKEAKDITKQALLNLKPRDLPKGGRYIGTYTLPEYGDIDIVSYREQWEDDVTGARSPMVPTKDIALVNPDDSFILAYGSYTDMSTQPAVTYNVARYPRMWYDSNTNVRWLEMINRPLPAPTRTNAWYHATVL